MKSLAINILVGPAFVWIGFWLQLLEPKMLRTLNRALDDGMSLYEDDSPAIK